MGATASLLALYRVDQQIRGLSSRLRSAETYLNEQDRLISDLERKHESISSQLRQLQASVHNDDTESSGIDNKIESLRERMNNARTSKEHAALLTEINTLKADKTLIEERELEAMGKLEALKAQDTESQAQLEDRRKVRQVAASERDKRAAEIKDRLTELERERAVALDAVPPDALAMYERKLKQGVEEPMAPVEEQSRRGMEYTCGSCYTHLPIERVSILLKRGEVTECPACKVILYMEDSLHESITSKGEKKTKKKVAANDSN